MNSKSKTIDKCQISEIKDLKTNLKRRGFKGKFIIPLPFPKIEN